MRILVTGSSGQIGTNLALRLLKDGHEVFGVDKRPNAWVGDAFPTLLQDLAGHYSAFPGGMNGVMLAREARNRQPDIKILLTTGYTEAVAANAAPAECEFPVISKPSRRDALSQTTRQVLDTPLGIAARLP